MHRAHFIGMGSNLGDRERYLDEAIHLMAERWKCSPISSRRFQTAPWEMSTDAPDFVNQVVRFELPDTWSPEQILSDILEIELALGRRRDANSEGYASRTIDLDLLAIEGVKLETPDLTLPHPRMHMRRFVLEPLCEIAPDFQLERGGPAVRDLLKICPDTSDLRPLVTPI